jgi:two-component system OmpR family sensor kinase
VTSTMSTPEQAITLKVSESATVMADPRRIRQCAENLLSNALKHSPKGTPVTVMVRRERHDGIEQARVDIIDQGPGIPSDVLPHIFERFVTGQARMGGTGLGLYIAHRIAVMHGGDLEVTTTPGEGTCISLTLACCADESAPPRR